MTNYTYIGNADPSENTTVLVLRNGTLKLPLWHYADLTSPEYTALAARYSLLPGAYGEPAEIGQAGSSKTLYLPINFLVSGLLDSSLVVPDVTIPIATGQASRIVAVRARIETGTSVDVQVRRNGSATGFALLNNVTTSWQTMSPAPNVSLTDQDAIDFTLADFQGSPSNLAVAVTVEHTV